jgi:glutaconate CoA-transferase subunit A
VNQLPHESLGYPWVTDFDARDRVADGSLIAIGGVGTSRKPMALVRAIVAAGVRDLRVISVLGSVDVDYLIAAGCVSEVHTAGVAIDGVGMAPRYRQARQSGEVRVIEWSEGSLHAALEAAGRGLGSIACATSPESDVVAGNPNLVLGADPFTADPVVYARAMAPDVTLLHVAEASSRGDLYIDGDAGFDVVTAIAATRVIASADRLTRRAGSEASLSRIWVDELVLLPGGSWPTSYYPVAALDPTALQAWVGSKGDASVLAGVRP